MRASQIALFAAIAGAAMLPAGLFAQVHSESVEVRITSVDVVVTDRSGKPIVGLPQDVFVLVENSKPQAITNFSEYGSALPQTASESESAASVPAKRADVLRERHFLTILIDNYTLDPMERSRIYETLRKSAATFCQEGDEVMLAVWDRGGARVRQRFTSDPNLITAALDQWKRDGGGGLFLTETRASQLQISRSTIVPPHSTSVDTNETNMLVSAWAAQRQAQIQTLLASATRFAQAMSGLRGKKTLLFVSESLPRDPGRQMTLWAQQTVPAFVPDSADENSRLLISEYERLTRAANASGVTIYPLYANIYSGARAALAAPDASVESRQGDAAEYANSIYAMQTLADATGGVVLAGASQYDKSIEQMRGDLAHYYSLGYRSEGDSSRRAVNVTVAGHPEYRVRTRDSFIVRSADEQMSDRVVANLFHATKGEFTIGVLRGAAVKKHRNEYRVPLQILIPSDLIFLPDQNEMAGGYSIFVAVSDPNGGLSPVAKQAQVIHAKPEVIAAYKGKALIDHLEIEVRGGMNTLSVGVRDDVGGSTGFTSIPIDTNAKPGVTTPAKPR